MARDDPDYSEYAYFTLDKPYKNIPSIANSCLLDWDFRTFDEDYDNINFPDYISGIQLIKNSNVSYVTDFDDGIILNASNSLDCNYVPLSTVKQRPSSSSRAFQARKVSETSSIGAYNFD